MCFSATASFMAATGLFAAGAVASSRVRSPREWPLALMPALFGLQQLVEGGVWLTFTPDAAPLNSCLTNVFSVFSQVLWPFYVPLAVLLLEATPWRRTVLAAFMVGGAAVGLFLGAAMVHSPVESELRDGHIMYVFPHTRVWVATTLYLLGACLAPMFSSHASLRMFGLAAALALAGTYAVYSTWLISVWCFFAAALSAMVLLHFAPGNGTRSPQPRLVLHAGLPPAYIQERAQNLQSIRVPAPAGAPLSPASPPLPKESP
jgi:hypothetical protein